MEPITPPRKAPLLALGDMPPRTRFIERPIIREIEGWLSDPSAPGALWVHGKPGTGRTTAVGAALRRAAARSGIIAAKRIAAHGGLWLEEALDDASGLLRQVGSESLDRVLDQRSWIRAKVAVLLQALEATRLLLWVDDLEALEGHEGPSSAVSYLVEGCARLAGRAGRVIIVSADPPPAGFRASIQVPPLSPPEAAELWSAASGIGPLPAWPATPLELLVLARATARLDALALVEMGKPPEASLLERLIDAIEPRLGDEARVLLGVLAVLRPEASRQALREVGSAAGLDLKLGQGEEDPAAGELLAWGLIESDPAVGRDGPPFLLSPPVRLLVAARLRKKETQAWRAIHASAGAYYLRLASRSAHLWHFTAAWRSFFEARHHSQAYEVHKLFTQELIRRGCFELARKVLEETAGSVTGLPRAVTLGNLAIIHKNTGDYDAALEIYGRVRAELMDQGDAINTARVLHQIGNTRYLKGDHAGALESYRSSLEASTALGDKAVAGATRVQIANLLYQHGDLRDALRAYEESLADARGAGESAVVAAVELQIGRIHFQEGSYIEAEARFRRAEEGATASGDLRNLLKVHEALAMIAVRRREYDQAREWYEKALRAAGALGDAIEGAATLILMGDMERDRLHLAEALGSYGKAKALLGTYAARGSGTKVQIDSVLERVEERLKSMENALGAEAFQRIARGLGPVG